MVLVDGHLDIGFQLGRVSAAIRGVSALAHREREGDLARRTLARSLHGRPAGNEAKRASPSIFPTIFLAPKEPGSRALRRIPRKVVYEGAAQAHRFGRHQLDRYRELHDDDGERVPDDRDVRWISRGSARGLGRGRRRRATSGWCPLLEGADPIRDPAELPEWKEAGLRIVGLAWRGTRYSAGTGEPGPLTPLGPRARARNPPTQGMILDLSHAAEEAFFEALELSDGRGDRFPLESARAMCNTDRQLSDRMIRAIADRNGVIGSVPFSLMLVEDWERIREAGRADRTRVAEAMQHTAEVAGRHEVVADRFGLRWRLRRGRNAPEGSRHDRRSAAPGRRALRSGLPRYGQIRDMLGGNWIRFLERTLPAS